MRNCARRPTVLFAVLIGAAVSLSLTAIVWADSPAAPSPASARQLKVSPIAPPPSPYLTDAQLGEAITKGAKFLAGRFVNSTLVESTGTEPMRTWRLAGADALAVYALLQSGLSIDEPQYSKDSKFMKGLIDTMKSLQSDQYNTYSRGIRATCLALLDRKEDHGALVNDVESLLDSCYGGGYSYGCPADRVGSAAKHRYTEPSKVYDNSNSQYGLLGVWSAAEVGAEIPNDYWEVVEHYWTSKQADNGQWYYSPGSALEYTMTMAGCASLFVCHDYIDVAKFGSNVGREPFSPALAKGLAWVEAGDNCLPVYYGGYGAYGLERVGLASGFKYFGTHDWFREVATHLLQAQQPNGAWVGGRGTEIETSYILLFLARGRHPIMMNKLRFEHFWANRPRDVARLSGYAGKELETVFNWQVVNLQHDWSDWTDSPILYIASHVAPQLTDDDYAKIRAFVNAGGLLFTQSDGGSQAFNNYVEKTLVHKVFPDYEMQKVPTDSPIYSVFQKLTVKPSLECVTNGARLLWVHSPADISQWWQQRASKSRADAFQLGMNIFVYAAGKRDFQNRIAGTYIPSLQEAFAAARDARGKPAPLTPPVIAPANIVNVARVKYPMPTWDPEPYAWTRLDHYLQWKTGVKAQTQVVEMDKLGDLSPSDVPLAHLTGTMPFTATDAQIQGIKKYVDNGGILFIDACGGGGFNDSIKTILGKAFAGASGHHLSSTSPLLSKSMTGMSDLPDMPVKQYVKSLGEKAAGFEEFSSGKGHVIYSSMDITNGLLGSQTWGISGYTGSFCLDFMKNLVLWSAQGAPAMPSAQK